jgi:hypothetical protein
MTIQDINPIRCLFNLAFGWFLLAFLQAAAVSAFSGGWADLWGRFLGIALFRNRTGTLINAGVVLALGGVGIAVWIHLLRR